MKTRPKLLTFFAAYLMFVAISIPLQIMFAFGHTPLELDAITAKIAPLNWAVILMCALGAWMLLRASTRLLVVLPLLALLVGYNNWLVGQTELLYSPASTALATLLFAFSFTPLMLSSQVRLAIMTPRKRWWLTPQRWKVEVPASFRVPELEIETRIFDLSKHGAFIAMEGSVETTENQIPLGAECVITFKLKNQSTLKCRAQVVRRTVASGSYPAGIGVRFLGLSWAEQKKLGAFLESQPALR